MNHYTRKNQIVSQINGNTSHKCQVNKIFIFCSIFWFLCSLSAAVINKFLIMEDSALKCIDERLDRLENLVYGPSSANTDNKCIETLINIQNKLQSSVTGKEKVTLLYNKLSELEKYLSPSFKENLTVNESVKLNLVLLDEDRVRKTVDSLQTVKDLSQYIESEHIKGVPSLFPKLLDVIQAQKTLQEKSYLLSEDTRKLIADYDNLVSILSKQFILWDAMLTEIEKSRNASSTKKLSD